MDSQEPETNIHMSNSYPRESINIKHTGKLLSVVAKKSLNLHNTSHHSVIKNRLLLLGIAFLLA